MYKRVVNDHQGLVGFQPKSVRFRLLAPYVVDHVVAKVEAHSRRAVFQGRVVSGLGVTRGTPEGSDEPNAENQKPVRRASFQLYESTSNELRGIGRIDHFAADEDSEEPSPQVELSLNVPPGTIEMLRSTNLHTHGNVVEAYLDGATCDLFADLADQLIWDITKARQATVLRAEFLSMPREPIDFHDPDGHARSARDTALEEKVSRIDKLAKLAVFLGVVTVCTLIAKGCR